MNWLKRLLGLDKQDEKLDTITLLTKYLLDKENKVNEELNSNLEQLNEKIEKTIANNSDFNQEVKTANQKMLIFQQEENKKSLEFKNEINTNLACMKNEVVSFTKIQQMQKKQLETVQTEVAKIVEEVLPKPFNPNFSLVDPLNFSKSLFLFEVTKTKPLNLEKTNVNTDAFLRNLGGSIPELVSGGLLSQSYRFVFPDGVSGEVMKMGSGQGTAIMQGGKIIEHGTYVKNFAVAAPLMAFSFGSMIIRQHYLAKLNDNLTILNQSVSNLIEFEFIKKQVKIEAIIYFFEKANIEYLSIENNNEYRSAVLSNLVSKNIEIFELIQFYKKSMKFIDNKNTSENELNFKYFLALHTLFYQGKLLEFKYAFEYNQTLISNLKTSFEVLNQQSSEFIISNKYEIDKQISKIDIGFSDWLLFRKARKEKQVDALSRTNISVDEILNSQKAEMLRITNELDQLINNITKKREYYIDNGELYEVI